MYCVRPLWRKKRSDAEASYGSASHVNSHAATQQLLRQGYERHRTHASKKMAQSVLLSLRVHFCALAPTYTSAVGSMIWCYLRNKGSFVSKSLVSSEGFM
jgi:hypothetical protein